MLNLSNEYLLRGLDTIEGITVRRNILSCSENEMFTSIIGLYNHFFVWTKEDMTYDIKFCSLDSSGFSGFDEEDYDCYEGLTLEGILNIIEEHN